MSKPSIDLRGLNPAPITPFTREGAVDYPAIQRLGKWLSSVPGVKSLTVLGHAGEGTFLEREEQLKVIGAFRESVGDRIPIIAGITLEGTQVAVEEAKRAVKAGASAGLVYPSHGWLRFGYQDGAPQDRYRAIFEGSGLPLILFQYPDATKCTYNLQTQLDIAAQPGVFAMKNGVRNMKRWDREIPVIRAERPDLQILTCHDEYLLASMVQGVDGALVGFATFIPNLIADLWQAVKDGDLKRAMQIQAVITPLKDAVYGGGEPTGEAHARMKAGMWLAGVIDDPTVRPPTEAPTETEMQVLRAAVAQAGLLKR